jgi:iron complex transport system ATP-binding protein
MDVTPLIEAEGLAIGHRGRAIATDIALSVAHGEVLVLLGPNGAGKTTLFRTLLGLLPALAGSVRLSGRDLATLSRIEIARAAALVPQALHAPFAFTAQDVVLMARTARLKAFARPARTDRDAAEAALDRMGIGHLAMRPVTELSGGQHQMVLIARALAQDTPLLVLDEPAASLDWGNRHRLMDRLENLAADGLGLILSTHEPDHAARLASRVLTIDAEGTSWTGPAAQALQPERLARLYGLPLTLRTSLQKSDMAVSSLADRHQPSH